MSLTRDNESQQIVGASVQTYLLEKSRVVHNNPGEGVFRIFYAILEDDALREMHGLQAVDASIMGETTAAVASSWFHFENAAQGVGISQKRIDRMVTILVAILHLLVRDYGSAATCLGLELTTLTHRLQHRRIRTQEEDIWTEVSDEGNSTRPCIDHGTV